MIIEHSLNEVDASDMPIFSILLIENQISVSTTVATTLTQHLTNYRLSIARNIPEALSEPGLFQVILLNISHLKQPPAATLAALAERHRQALIMLLVAETESTLPAIVHEALQAGADDYVVLSETGLLALSHRLELLHNRSPQPALEVAIASAFNDASSQLMALFIDTNERLLSWNQAAATFFGLENAGGASLTLDELALSSNNLLRFKDILDQGRASGQPFFIPTCPFDTPQGQIRWARVYVYPICRPSPKTGRDEIVAVGIISADISDFKDAEISQRRYSQELQVLLEIGQRMSGQLEPEVALEWIVDQTKLLFNADNCQVFLAGDEHLLRPLISVGPNPEQIYQLLLGLDQVDLRPIPATGKGRIINFIHSPQAPDETYRNHRGVHILYAPLTTSKQPLGLMVARRSNKAPFTPDDLSFFERLVQQASSAISIARLFEETQDSLIELSILYEASTVIATNWNIKEVLDTLVQQMVYATGVAQGYIVSWDQRQRQGTIEAAFSTRSAPQPVRPGPGHVFNLADRLSLSALIQQQRAMLFEINNSSLDAGERQDMVRYGCQARLLTPLVIKGETVGWAELWETRPDYKFTIDEIRLTRLLSNQAAMALKNAQYLQQMRRNLDETTALYQVASTLATTQDPQNIMSIVLQEYLRVLGLKQGRVVTFDFETKFGTVKINLQDASSDRKDTASLSAGAEGQQIPLKNDAIFEQLMRTHQPVTVEATETSSRLAAAAGHWTGAAAVSTLVIPINIREEVIGAIVVEGTRQKRRFDAWEISLGQAMADQLGIALQNVALYELESRRRQQAETLREVSFAVGSSLNLDEVLQRILEQLSRVIHYDGASIHLIEGGRRRIIAGQGFPEPEQVVGLTFPVKLTEDEPGSIVIHTRQPLMIGNIQEVYPAFREAPHNRIRTWMGIPLIARDRVIGLITVDRTEVIPFSQEEIELTQTFANQVAIALENARLYDIEIQEIERELEIAHEIQETLLPQFTPQVLGLQIAGRTFPMRQIGGDFFHFFVMGPEQFGVAIGDVSGKGIPAALYMAAATAAIDTLISHNNNGSPGQLLGELHQIFYRRLRFNRMNIGLQIATFALSPTETGGDQLMTIASGGMIAPIIANPNGCHLLSVGGLPLGSPIRRPHYLEEKIWLSSGTAVIFSSDGIVEAQNEAGELFSFERLEATISEVVHTQDAELIAEHIIYKAQEFMGASEPHDDMTVVVVVIA